MNGCGVVHVHERRRGRAETRRNRCHPGRSAPKHAVHRCAKTRDPLHHLPDFPVGPGSRPGAKRLEHCGRVRDDKIGSRGGAERFDARIAMPQPISRRGASVFTLTYSPYSRTRAPICCVSRCRSASYDPIKACFALVSIRARAGGHKCVLLASDLPGGVAC
jgi:hypothetical protein